MNATKQLATLRAISDPFRRAMVKQVTGGYTVTGVEQLQGRNGTGVLAELNCEGVATGPDDAVRMVRNFLLCGSFDDPIVDEADEDQYPLPIPAPAGAITAAEAPQPTVI